MPLPCKKHYKSTPPVDGVDFLFVDKIPKEVAIGFVLGFNNDKNITP